MQKCFFCAAENPPEAKVCAHCGRPMGTGALDVPRERPRLSWKAIVSLACGVFAWLPPVAVAAVLFGHLSRREIERKGLRGAGFSLGGLVLGYAGLALMALLLAAGLVSVPDWLRPRIERNEASAIASLEQLTRAAYEYAERYGQAPPDLLALAPPPGDTPSAAAAGLLSAELSLGEKSGYRFIYQPTDADADSQFDGFTVHAEPLEPGTTGRRFFFTDTSGVIHAEDNRPASASSPALPRKTR